MVMQLPLYGLSGERIVIGGVGIWKTWRFGIWYSSLGFEVFVMVQIGCAVKGA